MELSIPVPVPELPNVIPAHPWGEASQEWSEFGKLQKGVIFFQNIQKLYHNLVMYVMAITIEFQETVDKL